jgi:3-keto-disaccharide hydrolase
MARMKFLRGTLAFLALALAACRPGAPATPGTVLFADDFTDTNTGWNRGGGTDYADGMYKIIVAEPQTKVWANPGKKFEDVIVEVDAKTLAGPLDNDFGVQCRVRDNENYYFFLISADGFQVIGRVLKGEPQFISADVMQPEEAVVQGYESNHLRAACVGQELTLTVNGSLVAQASDDSLPDGDVGLTAGSYVEGGVEVVFDNFKVTQP